MMIDLATEQLLTLSQAAALLPSDGPRGVVSVATLRRWTRRGVHGVRLESAQLGSSRFTSVEALQRFAAAMEWQQREPPGPEPRRRHRSRPAAYSSALAAELDAAGW